MAVKDSTADEQSPLLPSSHSSSTVADESASTASENEQTTKISAWRGALLGACIAILIFLQTANFSLMTTIQSSIATDLDAFQNASWFTSTYLIAGASITPLAGRFSQIFSPRAYILVSCFIMATGNLVTSLSPPRLGYFLTGRALTGIGGAAVFPVSLILIIELTSVRRRGFYIGCVNTCYTIGIACGAILAGALEPLFGWRGVFFFQVPIAVAMGLGIFFALSSNTSSNRSTRTTATESESFSIRMANIDFLGALLLVSTVVLFLYGLSTPTITYSTIVLSLLTLLAFLLIESNPKLSSSHPILPLNILTSPPVLLTCLATLLAMISRWSILFYTPVYALAVRDFAPAKAGLILLPTNAGFALGNLTLGYFHVRRAGSFYAACLTVYVLFALTVLTLSRITTRDVGMGWYFAVAGANGFMIGASMIYTLTHVLHRTSKETHFIVSSLVAMFRGLSASFGSAIGGGFFARILKQLLEKGFEEEGIPAEKKSELIRRLLGSPALVSRLMDPIEREVAVGGYVGALRRLFAAAVVVATVAVVVQAGTGWRGVMTEGKEEGGGLAVGNDEEEEGELDDDGNFQIGAGRY